MGAYKKLNKQDTYITTYVAHKQWVIPTSQYTTYGIQQIAAYNTSYINSLRQLYYPSKSLASGNVVSHSFDYYPQTTLFNSESRDFYGGSTASIISIPRALYGNALQPGFVSLNFLGSINGTTTTGIIQDDGEGGLYRSGSTPRLYVGDVIYPHGLAVITRGEYANASINNISFKSSQPIYTYNHHCKVRESEYNFTFNPSALSGSLRTIYDSDGNIYSTTGSVNDGVLKNNVTGSSFQPYITTVGLYNDTNELIAVGKMGQPVPKPANTEMTIIVKIDI